jgi:hypothetical protein
VIFHYYDNASMVMSHSEINVFISPSEFPVFISLKNLNISQAFM